MSAHGHNDTSARFLVAIDVDSTLIRDEVIELIADEAGTRNHVAAITERAMRGEIDFEKSLRERVATLAGLPESVVARVRSRIRLTDGARELIDGVHRAHGRIGAVSGGFDEVLEPLARDLGLDAWCANRLEIVDGRLTGEVLGEVIDAAAKARTLREWAIRFGVPPQQWVAVGDGANDILMMGEARLSVAFVAKPRVRNEADIVIDRPHLAQVLPLLGLT